MHVCVCVCVSFDLVLNSLCSHDILDVLTLVNYEVGKGDGFGGAVTMPKL